MKKFHKWLKERSKILSEGSGLELIKSNGDWDTWYQMDIRQDEFLHFTTLSRAKEILQSKKLMMRPPYRKFGTDTVDAVSLVYGVSLPQVQWTHTKAKDSDPVVAIKFKTNALPSRATEEEVKWLTDVPLINPQIIDKEEAVSLLQSTPEKIDDMANVIYMPYEKFSQVHKAYTGDNGTEKAGEMLQKWSQGYTEAKKSSWVYHVTYLKNVEDIASSGLQPGGGGQSNFSGYEGWSKDKNFVTTTADGCSYWIDRLHEQTLNQYESGAWKEDNWVNDLRIPIVMRFPFNMRGLPDQQHDPELNRPSPRWGQDDQGLAWRDFYIKRSIPPEAKFEMWNGKHWQEPNSGIDVREFLDQEFDEYIQEENPDVPQEMAFYWVLKNPYPLPFWD